MIRGSCNEGLDRVQDVPQHALARFDLRGADVARSVGQTIADELDRVEREQQHDARTREVRPAAAVSMDASPAVPSAGQQQEQSAEATAPRSRRGSSGQAGGHRAGSVPTTPLTPKWRARHGARQTSPSVAPVSRPASVREATRAAPAVARAPGPGAIQNRSRLRRSAQIANRWAITPSSRAEPGRDHRTGPSKGGEERRH